MATGICIYCGESHLDICLGEHMHQCKKKNPKSRYSIHTVVERLDAIEKTIVSMKKKGV